MIAVVFTLLVTVVPVSAEFSVGKVRSVERGTGFEDVPVTVRNGVKALLRSPDIHADDQSRIIVAHNSQPSSAGAVERLKGRGGIELVDGI